MLRYKCDKILTETGIFNGYVYVQNEKIYAVTKEELPFRKGIDLRTFFLAPGFIDLHCHGGDGFEFIDATPEAFSRCCQIHYQHGTRILYPTFSASAFPILKKALTIFAAEKDRQQMILPGAHLEGPYLSPQMCGAQDAGAVRAPVRQEYTALVKQFGTLIKRWTYAPELDKSGAFIRFLTEHKIIASMGHSAATYAEVLPAFSAGCRLVTHLYSCTSTITRQNGFRKLGIIEAAFLLKDMLVEAIGDGCHLPPELLKMIVQIKGYDHVCLVSDAIRFAGIKNCSGLTSSGNIPYLIEDGVAKLTDRSAFAGSIATADVLLKQAVQAGIELNSAVNMLTAIPAKAMHLAEYGSITPGKRAVFTVFDKNFHTYSDLS